MQNNLQTILFIDDECDSYIESLEPFAKEAGFELQASKNVLEGLNFIKEYKDNVNAVILDLNFPIGEMQGFEALQIIKELQPYLPVIMLTVSYTMNDIDRVVECMRKGAYNYIGKRNLNVKYLFQVVEKAVSESKLQERIRIRNTVSPKKHLFFTVTTEYNNGKYFWSGIFGFELISINKPENEQEAAKLGRIALEWHENLLQSLSIIYCNEIQVNLKYIAEDYKIKCLIIFTVFGKDESSLDLTINSLQHDINAFFFPSQSGNIQPYIFEEISDSEYLLNTNNHSDNYTYNSFYREPIKVKAKQNIGFYSSNSHKSNNDSIYKPNELFSFPTNFQFDNGLFNALINQKEYVEIDVQLIPKQLQNTEIDLVKSVIHNTSLLDTTNLNDDEIKTFSDYLQKFIVSSKDKFLIGVILKTSSSKSLHHLKMSIQKYFFGLKENVNFQLRNSNQLLRYCTSTEYNPNLLPFFYSTENAIQIFRLPIPGFMELPGIKQQSQNFYYQPNNLSEVGIQLGIKKNVDGENEIRIDKESLARHLYIMGQTGTGKSTMLKTMILDCLNNNYGFTVIDPHGDLFDQVLKEIPKKKKDKVFIIDTTDPKNSLKFNPLAYNEDMPQAKSLVVNDILKIIGTLYDLRITGGPMFEQYFKNSLFLLLDEEVVKKFGKATLANMLNVFLNVEFRTARLHACANKNVTQFFRNAQATSGDTSFVNMAHYITSKLTRFVEDYYLSPILNCETNNINFRKIIDDGNIFLVKMDKGLIGSINTSLLGQIVLSKIFLAGMSRSTLRADKRKPHYIFIDEFQNFVKGDIGTALSEVRKYGLNLILANQTLGQLDDYLIQSLIGNVGSLVFFRPGIYDYEKLKYYIEPDFKREDVLKLPNFNCISRLMVNNVPSDPFVFQTKNI